MFHVINLQISQFQGRRWTELEFGEEGEAKGVVRSDSTSSSGKSECAEEFRARASTDSRLPPRPARPRHPLTARPLPPPVRRMSVAMRGNNASTYWLRDIAVFEKIRQKKHFILRTLMSCVLKKCLRYSYENYVDTVYTHLRRAGLDK